MVNGKDSMSLVMGLVRTPVGEVRGGVGAGCVAGVDVQTATLTLNCLTWQSHSAHPAHATQGSAPLSTAGRRGGRVAGLAAVI